ncbi:hypothetical protein JR316_0010442 [Psilocybe cubensis]|uniref:Uncharacterized protein n=2 Tax=Psilocybe cubensis TaxID=181762 RepID=A0ACB8GLA1_PSICU|nr:hypothetical protein JR316_0010442 [Psilocybe cubensis]KAH9476530.1 hypothetical protein JR316_0010442 [Psilocybe cubensis]
MVLVVDKASQLNVDEKSPYEVGQKQTEHYTRLYNEVTPGVPEVTIKFQEPLSARIFLNGQTPIHKGTGVEIEDVHRFSFGMSIAHTSLFNFMEIIQVSLDSPSTDICLRDLAESTSNIYKLLRPWFCSSQPCHEVFKPIKSQALSYITAIDFSITAAQKGYTFCDEVIAFAASLGSSNDADRQEYLRGMVDLAHQAEGNAERAKAEFRNVRIVVGQLVQDAKKNINLNQYETASSNETRLKEFEDGVSLLERFSACISSYISWWNTIYMSHKSQVTRQTHVATNYNKIRNNDVLTKWKELRQEYVFYTDRIQHIQDTNSDFRKNAFQFLEEHQKATSDFTGFHDGYDGTHSDQLIPPPSSRRLANDQVPFPSTHLNTGDPTALLFIPIAISYRHLARHSSTMGKRERFLHFIGLKHQSCTMSKIQEGRHGEPNHSSD